MRLSKRLDSPFFHFWAQKADVKAMLYATIWAWIEEDQSVFYKIIHDEL